MSVESRSDQPGYANGSQVALDQQEKDGEADRQKRRRLSRARIACLPCRTKKNKCGSVPPAPCQNCLDAEIVCVWPSADGRSSRARLERSKHSTATVGSTEPHTSMIQTHTSEPLFSPPVNEDTPDWLTRLFAADTPATSNFSAFPPTTVNPAYDLNLPGPSNYFTTGLTPPFGNDNNEMLSSTLGMSNALNPADFMWAMSSQLPMMEESSPAEAHSGQPMTEGGLEGDAGSEGRRLKRNDNEGKIVKISWWRPHGQTAIAPGLKRITLKVRVNTPSSNPSGLSPGSGLSLSADPHNVFAPDGAPSIPVMKHLLDIFMIHFGCQFPFIDRRAMEQQIEKRTGSVFLLNCIAGLSARFSSHPAIALPDLEPWAYGNIFYSRAKALLGEMLSVPSREVIAGFVMLSHMSFANDSESELWILTGMAVRMSIDLGLHINPPDDSTISVEDRRLNRLVFFSVLLMDYALSFGVGRQTTFRTEDITQVLPTRDDIASGDSGVRSPFPFAAEMMLSYGTIINMLNRERGASSVQSNMDLRAAQSEAIKKYNQLPQDMQWNVQNLQTHCRNNQGPIFLHIHLWMHTILASDYLTGSDMLKRNVETVPALSNTATPNSATASRLWRNSVRTIGDILVLSDIINSHAYFALPFTNQALFVAGCCYVKEIEQHQSRALSPKSESKRQSPDLPTTNMNSGETENSASTTPDPASSDDEPKNGRPTDLSRALLTSVAKNNIATLQTGLQKQALYWSGVAWVKAALEKRIEGFHDVDLQGVTEKLKSFVSLPDAGLIGYATGSASNEENSSGQTRGQINGENGINPLFVDLNYFPLPFDIGAIGDLQNVVETQVSLSDAWRADWFS